MKTYNLCYALLALVILGCSKSVEPVENEGEVDTGSVEADYNLLVVKDGMLGSTLINATAEVTTLNPTESPFEEIITPDLTYKNGDLLTMYHQVTDCNGKISQFDFSDNTSQSVDLFTDFDDCDLTATAIAHSSEMFYITYGLETTPTNFDYFVRVIDPSKTESNFTDIPLKAEPQDPILTPKELVFANNRLFILAHDADATNEYRLVVMNAVNNNLVSNVNLGFNVKQIFKDPADNIIVSYNESHTKINSGTLAVEYTNYGSGTEPHFVDSKFNYFDATGRMYYEMPSGSHSSYPFIPAVYDFTESLGILYAYENFLTETERDFEFEIESTTMVSFDDKNDLLLIGYKKAGGSDKGGLMRIKPAPEPEFIDNLDLDGIPYDIFIK